MSFGEDYLKRDCEVGSDVEFHQNKLSPHDKNSQVFMDRLNKFIEKKENILFSEISLKGCSAAQGIYIHESLDALSAENYTTVPPIEIFMDVPKQAQIDHFYKSIERGKVVTGAISSLVDSGFYMTLVGVDVGQARNIAEWKIIAFCPSREIPTSNSHDDPLAMFVVQDKVRAVVTKVMDDKITVSLHNQHLANCFSNIKLGIITDEEVSLYYSRTKECHERSYEEVLRNSLEYENPSNTANLALMFGLCHLESRPSIMEGLYNVKYDKKEYADYLRKSQSHRLAMINVKEALLFFKQNKTIEAMQLANKALDIDSDNVEALVIRGALFANSESYAKAMDDFEEALKHEPNHANALKYLIQVLLTYAKNKVNEDQVSFARRLLDRAVQLNVRHADRETSKSIDDLMHDIRRKENQLEKNRRFRGSRDGEKRSDRSLDEKNFRGDRRLSSSSSHHNANVLKYYSPVYLNDEEEAFGPELPPASKVNKKKRRRSSSSGSSLKCKSSKKLLEPPTKRRKTKGRYRKRETSSSSSSSSQSSSSSSSSVSSSNYHKKTSKIRRNSKHSPVKVHPTKSSEFDQKNTYSKDTDLKKITKNMIDSNHNRNKAPSDKSCVSRSVQEKKISLPVRQSHQEHAACLDKSKPTQTLEDMEHFLNELKCKQKQKLENV